MGDCQEPTRTSACLHSQAEVSNPLVIHREGTYQTSKTAQLSSAGTGCLGQVKPLNRKKMKPKTSKNYPRNKSTNKSLFENIKPEQNLFEHQKKTFLAVKQPALMANLCQLVGLMLQHLNLGAARLWWQTLYL